MHYSPMILQVALRTGCDMNMKIKLLSPLLFPCSPQSPSHCTAWRKWCLRPWECRPAPGEAPVLQASRWIFPVRLLTHMHLRARHHSAPLRVGCSLLVP